ncbi:MAG: hypothetical protein IT371_20145 [Deltaproteobacteria bacterium]|nr:hypothetical protein [Deltaproteobacteria bacterium]
MALVAGHLKRSEGNAVLLGERPERPRVGWNITPFGSQRGWVALLASTKPAVEI